METFFGGIGLAALTALGVIAYRHPEAMRRIHIPLQLLTLVLVIVAGVRDITISNTYGWLSPLIADSKSPQALQLINDKRDLTYYLVFGGLAMNVYLTLLVSIPLWLKPENSKKE